MAFQFGLKHFATALLIVTGLASPAAAQTLSGEYTIQQQSSGRYLDAHEGVNDNSVVTRNPQNNATQVWIITKNDYGNYWIRQQSSQRFMDAHEGVNDNSVVTRAIKTTLLSSGS